MLSYLAYFIWPIWKWWIIFLLTLPLTIILTHIFLRKKNISIFQKIWVYLLVFFFFLALGLVLFPFPDFTADFCDARKNIQIFQLTPFQFFEDIKNFAEKHNVSMLRNKALFQVIFNIFLILPIWFLLWLLFKIRIYQAFFIGLGISLFFETIQGTAIFGFLPCAYRLFDVDDLFLNTFGFLVWFLMILPFRKYFKKFFNREEFIIKKENFFLKRFFAFIIDYILALVIFKPIFWIFLPFLKNYWFNFLELFLYFVVLVYFMKWQSFGKKLLKIKIVPLKWEKLTFSQIFIRSLIPILSFPIFNIALFLINPILLQNGFLVLLYFIFIIFFVLISTEISTDWRAFHEKISKTKIIEIKKS